MKRGTDLPQVNSAIDSIIRHENITVILVAHRLSSIARAERVIVLEGGAITEIGPYDELVNYTRVILLIQYIDQDTGAQGGKQIQDTDGRSAVA